VKKRKHDGPTESSADAPDDRTVTTDLDSPLSPSPTAPFISCSASAPDWFRHALDSVTATPLSDGLQEIVRLFVEVETVYKFEWGKRSFASEGRPALLTKWVRGGRWRRPAPSVTNIGEFSTVWWQWWVSLQPGWRKFEPGGRPCIGVYGNDWDCLKMPGPNGWLSVVATLFWWGRAIKNEVDEKEYTIALKDVNFMMQGLLENLKVK
jgi:hypothetical protein